MALSRVTTWATGNTLTASALNGEFNNILDNALSLISPLTANLNADGFNVTNLGAGSLAAPGVAFTGDSNTGLTSLMADVLDFSCGGLRAFQIATAYTGGAVNYLLATPAAAATWPTLAAAGTDANLGIRLQPLGTGWIAARRGRSVGEVFWPSFGFYEEHGRAGVAGLVQIAAGTVDLIAEGRRVIQASGYVNATNYLRVSPSATGNAVVADVAGGDTNIPLTIDTKGTGRLTLGSADVVDVTVATALVPASLGAGPSIPNTPLAHALYRENVVKGWINFKGTTAASIYGSFNVTSLSRGSLGAYQITWDRDFAATPYAVAGACTINTGRGGFVTLSLATPFAVGVCDVQAFYEDGVTRDADVVTLIAIGAQ
jgi:hypothetical protein